MMRGFEKKFTQLITNIFHYYSWMPIVLWTAVFKAGLQTAHIKSALIILTGLDVVAPLLAYIFLLNGGKITDASLIRRQDRPVLFAITTGLVFTATVFAYFLGTPLFFKLHFVLFIFMLTLFLITMFFKISGHMFLNTFCIFILNFMFGWNILWLFLIVPVVAYARLYLKAHTPAEVLAGAAIGLIEPYLILKLLKLL